ncbi:MAG: hypothetical protein R2932_52790 [Caldilineaceae bacterium]
MVEEGTQAAMTFRQVAQIGRQKVEIGGNLMGNRRTGHGADPTGRQFQRQRHAFHQPADGSNLLCHAVR